LVSNTFEMWTGLFTLFAILGTAVGVVVISYMVYLIAKYRTKDPKADHPESLKLGEPPREHGKGRELLISLILSSIIVTTLIIGSFGVMDTIETLPQGTLDIRVIGFQWNWKFIYPNGYTAVGELRVPKGEVVRLWVESEDVFHNFGIIEYRIKIDAIPGKTNAIWFKPYEEGVYRIQCYELCGVGHLYMTAKLVVMEPEEFEAWYSTLEVGG